MDWLLKTEPSEYAFDDLVRERTTVWDGVTNALAQKHLRAMVEGDRLVVYHTGGIRAAVGRAVVSGAPRPSGSDPRLVAVPVRAGKALARPVPLDALRAEPAFAGSPLLTQGRLSVVPLTREQHRFLTGE